MTRRRSRPSKASKKRPLSLEIVAIAGRPRDQQVSILRTLGVPPHEWKDLLEASRYAEISRGPMPTAESHR